MAQLDVVIKAVDASRAGISSFNRRIEQTTDKIGGVSRTSKIAAGAVAGLAAVGVGAFANLAGKALQVADNVDKMNRTTGLSTTFIQGLAHAADQSGTSIEAVNKGFLRATRVLADAERGLKTSEEALAKIGFTTEDLAGLKPDELFRKLADGVAGVEDPTKRAAVAQEVFGRAGAELIPLLEGGAAGVDAFVKEAQGLGIVLDEGAIRASAEFNDKLDVLKKQGLALVQKALAELLPVLTSVVDFLSENATEAVIAMGAAIGVLTAVAMPALIASIKAMTAALLANPIGLVIAALVALGAGLFIAWRKSETFRNIVTGAFEAVMNVVRKVVSTMLNRLAGLIEGIASIASMFTWLPGPVGDAMEKVRDALNSAAHALRGWADTVEGKLDDAGTAYTHFANHIRQFEADTKKNLDGFAEGAANMSDEFVRHLDVMALNTQEFADNQRRAFEAHYEGLTMLRRQHELTERIERQAHLRAMQTGFAKQFADAQRDRAIGLQRWAAGTSEFHRQMEADTEEFHRKINKSAKQSTEKQLSESERLAKGLLVSMTNACGAVTGFRQCVDGVVVEFDADMNRILSEADQLASGLAVPITNACGTVTGFRQCVDGMVVEFDENMQRIEDAADSMADGVSAAASRAAAALSQLSGLRAGVSVTARASAGELTAEDIAKRQRLIAIGHRSQEFKLKELIDRGLGGSVAAGIIRQRLRKTSRTFGLTDADLEGLPGLARGGIVTRPTLAMIGEAGPEAVLPLSQAGGMERPLTVVLELDGSRLGEAVVSNVNKAAREGTLLLSGSYDA